MTTLAQMLVESQWDWAPDSIGNIAMRFVKKRLQGSKNLLLPSGPITEGVCERFAFSEDAPGLMYDLVKSGGIDKDAIWHQTRMPSPICWIEWRTIEDDGEPLLFGALLDSTLKLDSPQMPGARWTTAVFCAATPKVRDTFAAPIFLGELPSDLYRPFEIDCWRDAPPRWKWSSYDDLSPEEQAKLYSDHERLQFYYRLIKSALYALFLIVTPRVCEIREVDHPRKLQERRRKDRKEPLIEYRKVTLRIGGSVRYVQSERRGNMTAAEEEAQRRKFHHVIGHFRTYYRGSPKQRIAWIDDHWRGDPKLGIILHDREVRR